MSKISRAFLVVFALAVAGSLAIAIAAMRHALPPGRLVGILALAFWILVYVVFRYIARNLNGASISSSHSVTTPKSGFVALAPTLGKFYLFSGVIAVLLGTMASRNQEAFFTAGAVVFCFGGYLIFLGKKSKRGA